MVLQGGGELPLRAVREVVQSALDLVVHVGRGRGGRRRVAEVVEVLPPGRGERVRTLAQNLAHLNPQGVLARGYAIVATLDGAIVHDARQLTPGDDVALQFALGKAGARVTKVEPA